MDEVGNMSVHVGVGWQDWPRTGEDKCNLLIESLGHDVCLSVRPSVCEASEQKIKKLTGAAADGSCDRPIRGL